MSCKTFKRPGVGGAQTQNEPALAISLEHLVKMFLSERGCNLDDERARHRKMSSLSEAIRNAAGAINARGKCDAHQRRVGFKTLARFEQSVQARAADLRRCRTFKDLHELVAKARVRGVGALTIYDTAARLGYFLKLEPQEVYLHAGTRAGARALGVSTSSKTIPLTDLPKALRGLTARQVEDFLCIYKDELPRFAPARP